MVPPAHMLPDVAKAAKPRQGHVRRARAEALATFLAAHPNGLSLDRWVSFKLWGWTRTDFERAVDDLVAMGRARVEVGHAPEHGPVVVYPAAAEGVAP